MSELTRFFKPGAKVTALPSWSSPRLLMSSTSPLARWRQSEFYPAFKPAAKVLKQALKLKALTGLGEREVEGGPRLPVPFEPSAVTVLAGTQGPAQKLTAQLWKNGRVGAYLKFASLPAAKHSLEREREMLSALPPGLGPELLSFGTFADGLALVTEPVAGAQLAATLPVPDSVALFLDALEQRQERPAEGFAITKGLLAREPRLVEPWLKVLGGKVWPVCYHHGDFTPWNVLASGTELRAIDWEYGSLEAPPHLDLAFYVLQVSALIYKTAPTEALDKAAATLKHFRPALSRAEAEVFVKLSAFYAYVQAETDGHPADTFLQQWRVGVYKNS